MDHMCLSPAVVACYDNSDPPAPPAGAPVPTPLQPPATPAERRFTQEDVNRLLADDRRKHQSQIARVQATLEETLASKNLTIQEREQLAQQVEELQAQGRTKEQQLAHEKSQLETQHAKALEDEKKATAAWRKRFESQTKEDALRDAAHKSGAFSDDQIIRLLMPSTRLVEKTDERGQGTGDFEAVVDLPDTDDNGDAITRTLPPRETLRVMQAKPTAYGNLFKSGVVAGIGSGTAQGTPGAGGGKIDPRKLTQQQYMEIREKNPALLGLRPNKQGHR